MPDQLFCFLMPLFPTIIHMGKATVGPSYPPHKISLCVYICTCVHKCVEARAWPQMLPLRCCPLCFLKQGPSLVWGSKKVKLAGQGASVIHLFLPPQCLQACTLKLSISVLGFWEPNSSLHTCKQDFTNQAKFQTHQYASYIVLHGQ